MQVEVWSPDGIEAQAHGSLTEVAEAENGKAICLRDTFGGARVWLEPDEVDWLLDLLNGRKAARSLAVSSSGENTE